MTFDEAMQLLAAGRDDEFWAEAKERVAPLVQDVPLLSVRAAQRLWQHAAKAGPLMTKPTLVRLARSATKQYDSVGRR